MSKHALIADIATKTNESQACVGRILAALAEKTSDMLKEGEDVTLPGIGKLKVDVRKARTVKNPSNGNPIDIPAKNVVKLTTAKALRDALN